MRSKRELQRTSTFLLETELSITQGGQPPKLQTQPIRVYYNLICLKFQGRLGL